jgi:type IV secretory pathway TrbF-like protein
MVLSSRDPPKPTTTGRLSLMQMQITNYEQNARRYNDVLGIPLRTIHMQRLLIMALAFVIVLIVVGMGASIIVLTNRISNMPLYAFGYDRTQVKDGHGQVISENAVPINIYPMDTPDQQLREANADYWLPIIVRSIFTVSSIDTDKANLTTFVQPFIAPGSSAERTLHDYFVNYNPVIRGQQQHVNILVDPIAPPRQPNVYHVTWTAETKDTEDRLINAKQQGATIVIGWGKPNPRVERDANGTTFGGNPPGLYIEQIDSDRPLDPRAAAPGGNQ